MVCILLRVVKLVMLVLLKGFLFGFDGRLGRV